MLFLSPSAKHLFLAARLTRLGLGRRPSTSREALIHVRDAEWPARESSTSRRSDVAMLSYIGLSSVLRVTRSSCSSAARRSGCGYPSAVTSHPSYQDRRRGGRCRQDPILAEASCAAISKRLFHAGRMPFRYWRGFLSRAVVIPRKSSFGVLKHPGVAGSLRADCSAMPEGLALGSKAAGDAWVFTPNDDLRGITPAEALQYRTHATGVGSLLEIAAQRQREETRPDGSDRPTPVLIEGGRSADDTAA